MVALCSARTVVPQGAENRETATACLQTWCFDAGCCVYMYIDVYAYLVALRVHVYTLYLCVCVCVSTWLHTANVCEMCSRCSSHTDSLSYCLLPIHFEPLRQKVNTSHVVSDHGLHLLASFKPMLRNWLQSSGLECRSKYAESRVLPMIAGGMKFYQASFALLFPVSSQPQKSSPHTWVSCSLKVFSRCYPNEASVRMRQAWKVLSSTHPLLQLSFCSSIALETWGERCWKIRQAGESVSRVVETQPLTAGWGWCHSPVVWEWRMSQQNATATKCAGQPAVEHTLATASSASKIAQASKRPAS